MNSPLFLSFNSPLFTANADIYFDRSLQLFGDPNTLDLNGGVLALLKYTENNQGYATLNVRTDSQDAWIFQPPINSSVILKSNFIMGAPSCDNVIAEILSECGHIVSNPAFAIHAVEVHNSEREGLGYYSPKNAVVGKARDVLLSDQMLF